jgi:hypothetical protein
MKIKTSELTGPALDWAVCFAQHPGAFMSSTHVWLPAGDAEDDFLIDKTSTDWAQGGPIIEREEIELKVLANCLNTDNHPTFKAGDAWEANLWPVDTDLIEYCGPTPLIAAMRCYVASKLGDEVEVPDELA